MPDQVRVEHFGGSVRPLAEKLMSELVPSPNHPNAAFRIYLAKRQSITVRVEPVGEFDRKHGLEDCYCFASNYPHAEGGVDPMARFANSLKPLGERAMEKFYCTNGRLLLPD